MGEAFQEDFDFKAANDAADDGQALLVDIDGYEGPLHLLLDLARKQKVDITNISILELADQYIHFIKTANELRIELAADYLVMASWLAYLKSRLIIPKETEGNVPEEEDSMALHLAFRLERLDAMRVAADGLLSLPEVGQQVFKRGMPEGLRSRKTHLWEAEIFDILSAYGVSRSRSAMQHHIIEKPMILSLSGARKRLKKAIMSISSNLKIWTEFSSLLPQTNDFEEAIPIESVKASTLLASLELSKEGDIQIRQDNPFSPIYIRNNKQ
jgi:segregation and condensation protein A